MLTYSTLAAVFFKYELNTDMLVMSRACQNQFSLLSSPLLPLQILTCRECQKMNKKDGEGET